MRTSDEAISVQHAALSALLESDPSAKCAAVESLHQAWLATSLKRAHAYACPHVEVPGRPAQPELVDPQTVPRRNPHTREGHAALIHAIAHIEFNAINLALDCVARFSAAGDEFVNDWLRVANEEAHHFSMLSARLEELGFFYGSFPAHNGLWEMALKTDADFTARMALVPRLLEARGLDATPPIQAKLRDIGDRKTLSILDIILRDEVGHVAVGDRWFRAACAQAGVDPVSRFRQLLDEFGVAPPRPPMNRKARREAGFSEQELDDFEALALVRKPPRN
ncbi:MAG: ferritin-like domain-containing protein [Rhodocyclaceae bacterium]